MSVRNHLFGYEVVLSKRAEKSLDKLPNKIHKDIIEKLDQLVALDHNLDIKKLDGHKNFYRIRFGNYRIVYEPLNDQVIVYVLLIGHRKDIYVELKKLVL